jgi:hypothetical protein
MAAGSGTHGRRRSGGFPAVGSGETGRARRAGAPGRVGSPRGASNRRIGHWPHRPAAAAVPVAKSGGAGAARMAA